MVPAVDLAFEIHKEKSDACPFVPQALGNYKEFLIDSKAPLT